MRLKKVGISTFERQTCQRKSCFALSFFIKEKWFGLRGLDVAGKSVEEDGSKPDSWKNASRCDKLIKKYGGDIFSETRLDDELFSIVEKNEPVDKKDLAKQQRLVGSMAHLALPLSTRS